MKFLNQSLINILKRNKFQKADTFCFLLQDCKLGEKGDIIQVSQEKARNLLLPLQIAYYVPRIRGKPLLPENWEPSLETSEMELEKIVPAFSNLSDHEISEILSLPDQKQNQSLMNQLKNDSKITIYSKAIPGSGKLFGSIGKDEIIQQIQQKFSERLEPGQIILPMDKIKDIGSVNMKVSFGGEDVDLVLEILDLKT